MCLNIRRDTGETPCETHTSSMAPRKNPSLREEEENGFSMNEGGCVPEKTSDKEGRSDFLGGPARLQSLPSMPASGQRMLRPLVSAWQAAPARCGRRPGALGRQTQGPAVKVLGVRCLFLFAKGVEVEIAFAFLNSGI